MARTRYIKPGFFDNEILSELDPLARLLFIGLWCIADKEGRLEDRPKRIKKEVLGYDDCDCDELLDDLRNAGFIDRYVAEGGCYIQICKFDKHQKPHSNESASTIPANTSTISPSTCDHGGKDLLPKPKALPTIEESTSPLITRTLNGELEDLYGELEETNVSYVEAALDKKSPRPADEIDSRSFTDPVKAAVRRWLKYKGERREQYKPTGLSSLLTQIENRLKEAPEGEVIRVISESMASNYQGIVWDKLKARSPPGGRSQFDELED